MHSSASLNEQRMQNCRAAMSLGEWCFRSVSGANISCTNDIYPVLPQSRKRFGGKEACPKSGDRHTQDDDKAQDRAFARA